MKTKFYNARGPQAQRDFQSRISAHLSGDSFLRKLFFFQKQVGDDKIILNRYCEMPLKGPQRHHTDREYVFLGTGRGRKLPYLESS